MGDASIIAALGELTGEKALPTIFPWRRRRAESSRCAARRLAMPCCCINCSPFKRKLLSAGAPALAIAWMDGLGLPTRAPALSGFPSLVPTAVIVWSVPECARLSYGLRPPPSACMLGRSLASRS